jgi:glycine cleavage system aminomethyltransferase T
MLASPFEPALQRAGAVLVTREDARVAAHFGSPAGELAVCLSAVGLHDRSALAKLELHGERTALARLLLGLCGGRLASGGALRAESAWWCAASPERLTVLCEPAAAARERLAVRLARAARSTPGVVFADRSDELAALALLGPSTVPLLAALGALGAAGDPRLVAPFGETCVAGIPVQLLAASDRNVLLLAERSSAAALWDALEGAGRPFGLTCVGSDAAARFALLERLQKQQGGVAPVPLTPQPL